MKDWQQAQKDFEDHWIQFGKKAWVHRFSDTAQAIGMSGRGAVTAAQPSDYLVTHEGVTFFAEVKHSADPVSFAHSGIRPKQAACARMSIPAGALYFFFIKSKALGKWFCVPASVIYGNLKSKSTRWADIQEFEWSITQT